MISTEKKTKIVVDLQASKTDTGSSAVQVGIFTERIRELTEHLKANKHDFMARRGLLQLVGKRKRLLQCGHRDGGVGEANSRALKELSRSFARLYANEGRPSVPPEQLLNALLIQALYGIRSERQLMEQLNYNLLYRWFVGLSPDDAVWDATTFTKQALGLAKPDPWEPRAATGR